MRKFTSQMTTSRGQTIYNTNFFNQCGKIFRVFFFAHEFCETFIRIEKLGHSQISFVQNHKHSPQMCRAFCALRPPTKDICISNFVRSFYFKEELIYFNKTGFVVVFVVNR